jgi:ChaC-like protein
MSVYIFGYGSLINKEELKNEFNIKKKIIPVIVSGFTRSFDVSSSSSSGSSGGKYKVLGIKNKKGAWCNGIVFKVNEEELDKLIERESNYTIKTIEQNRISFDYGKQLTFKKDDQVLCFYPKPLYRLNKKQSTYRPIRPNYETICLEGARAFGSDFLRDFSETTRLL